MATIDGDLLESITQGAEMAVLVIDEFSEDVPAYHLSPQIAVINQALLSEIPIIFVEIKQEDNIHPTNSHLRQAASGAKCEVVTKPGINAFVNSRLKAVINAFNATTLVVLGQHVNMCVKTTVIGGREPGTGGNSYEGAVQLGYRVLSSDLIVRPRAAIWQKSYPIEQIAFYKKVGTYKVMPVPKKELPSQALSTQQGKKKPLPTPPSRNPTGNNLG